VEKQKIKNYKDLVVWQKSMRLATCVYKLVEVFPKNEIFGLSSQVKRSVVSIPANIAEGSQRSSRKDFAQFLHMSLGSCAELETELLIAKQLCFGKELQYNEAESLMIEISKMLKSLIFKLKTQN